MPTYTLCDPQVSSKGPIVPVTIDITEIGDTFKKDKPPDAIEDCLIGIDILSEMVFVYIGPMDTFSLSY